MILPFNMDLKNLLIVFAMLIVCILAGFYIGYDSGQKAYASFLNDNDIYCMEKTNPLFTQIGAEFMNKSEVGVKLNARIPN